MLSSENSVNSLYFILSSICSPVRYMLVTRMCQLTWWQRVENPLDTFYLDNCSLSPDWSNWQRAGNSSHNSCLTEKWLSISGCRACEKSKRLNATSASIQLLILLQHVHVFQLSNFFSDPISISHGVLSHHMLLSALSHFPRTLEKLKSIL